MPNFSQGESATLRVGFYDIGELFDPNNISRVSIYDPDDNIIANFATATREQLGVYSVSYTIPATATLGIWKHVWQWRGTESSSYITQEYEFTVVEGAVSGLELIKGDDNWVIHDVTNTSGEAVLDLTYNDVRCMYWHDLLEDFAVLSLNNDNFYVGEVGEYRVRYGNIQIVKTGPFISLLYPTDVTGFSPSFAVTTAISTVTGTCAVSGQFLDMSGEPITEPVEVIIENLYNPTTFSNRVGGVVTRTNKYYSNISGEVELPLIREMVVRVSIGRLGISKTITIPDAANADLFTLIENSTDTFEPL